MFPSSAQAPLPARHRPGLQAPPSPEPGESYLGDLLGGCDAPLRELTRLTLEATLNAELEYHLAHAKDSRDRLGINSHNGYRLKSVLTAFGPVEVNLPRDRNGSFTPAILPRYRRGLAGRETAILALAARGLPYEEFLDRFADIYENAPKPAPLRCVADSVAEQLRVWQRRPLAPAYLVLFADTVPVRQGRAFVDAVLAVTAEGRRELLSLWAAPARGFVEGAAWGAIVHDLGLRGVRQVSLVVGDDTPDLVGAARRTWPGASVRSRPVPRPRPAGAPLHLPPGREAPPRGCP